MLGGDHTFADFCKWNKISLFPLLVEQQKIKKNCMFGMSILIMSPLKFREILNSYFIFFLYI